MFYCVSDISEALTGEVAPTIASSTSSLISAFMAYNPEACLCQKKKKSRKLLPAFWFSLTGPDGSGSDDDRCEISKLQREH